MPVVVVFGSGENIDGSFEYDSAELAGKFLAESDCDIITNIHRKKVDKMENGMIILNKYFKK